MNKQIRTQMQAIVSNLQTELDKLRDIYDSEVEKFDNIPENLLYSERCQQMEEDNDNLCECVDSLEDIVDVLDGIVNN